jgi:hypothetical protein
VDNTAKAILDDVASKLKNDPNAKIVIVGYADGEKAPMEGTGKNRHPMNLAAQRAVNAKAYLVQQQGIDPSRVEVRQGTGQQKVADIIWVPQGADENTCADLQNTTPVDESVVKPRTVIPLGRALLRGSSDLVDPEVVTLPSRHVSAEFFRSRLRQPRRRTRSSHLCAAPGKLTAGDPAVLPIA